MANDFYHLFFGSFLKREKKRRKMNSTRAKENERGQDEGRKGLKKEV